MTDIEPIKELSTGSIELVSFDCIYGSTIRIWIKINGMLFKRIYDRSGLYPSVWSDEEYSIGDTIGIQDREKEKELESIFQAWCIEQKLNFMELTNPKKLKP